MSKSLKLSDTRKMQFLVDKLAVLNHARKDDRQPEWTDQEFIIKADELLSRVLLTK